MSVRLFLQILSIEARKRMSYRVDFWLTSVVGFLAEFGVAYFLWQAMFRESGSVTIGGYSQNGMVIYYLAVILLGKVVRGVEFAEDTSNDIYQGGLNRYLVFPTAYFPFKYAQHIGAMLPNLLQVFVLGGLSLLLIDMPDDVHITLGTVLMCTVSCIVANLLYFAMRFPILCVAFWADNVWSLSVALRFVTRLLGGGILPLTLFPLWAQSALDWMPFRALYATPAESLLGRMSLEAWGTSVVLALAWTAVILAIGRLVWKRGDLRYTGVGI